MSKTPVLRLGTRAVHAGLTPSEHMGAVTTPIYQSATFVAADTDELMAINTGAKRGYVYSRIRNPTVVAAEQRIASLEESESCVLFSSGMAAIVGALAPFLKTGDDVVVLPEIYGGSLKYFRDILPGQGTTVTWAKSISPDNVEAAITSRTKVIYAETPTNPLVRIVDLQALGNIATKHGLKLIVDGTLGGPLNQQPLQLGADLVVHSASKYLNGHGDLIVGAVCGGRSLTRDVRSHQQITGSMVDAHSAWLLMRGIATFALRMRQHNTSGLAVATFLESHPKIDRVLYPGLQSHPDHALAVKTMQGFGGLMSFETDSPETARQVVDRTRLFGIGPSVGGVESLISQPGNTSHFAVAAEQRLAMGISDRLVRISVGIEDTADLIEDLQQALEN
ncbi:PLP-dependent transferase [Ochrobactrum sp. XJ1]|nr:PLP-dependent transferase [Ochrobactrum sp. XJ1]